MKDVLSGFEAFLKCSYGCMYSFAPLVLVCIDVIVMSFA